MYELLTFVDETRVNKSMDYCRDSNAAIHQVRHELELLSALHIKPAHLNDQHPQVSTGTNVQMMDIELQLASLRDNLASIKREQAIALTAMAVDIRNLSNETHNVKTTSQNDIMATQNQIAEMHEEYQSWFQRENIIIEGIRDKLSRVEKLSTQTNRSVTPLAENVTNLRKQLEKTNQSTNEIQDELSKSTRKVIQLQQNVDELHINTTKRPA
jgi:chromosome segregation ATPase